MNENYCKVKDLMKTGDALFWESYTVIGWLIRLKKAPKEIYYLHPEIPEGYNPNHVSSVIRLKEYEGEERNRFCLEALEDGYVLNRLSKRLEAFNGTVWWFPLKPDWNERRVDIGRNILSYVGTDYDYGSLFKNAVCHVSTDGKKLFCSEAYYMSLGFSETAPRPNELLALDIFGEGVRIK